MRMLPAVSKNHSKRQASNRDRDRNKVATESGGSSQCDTPPLNDKESNSIHGKYAGIAPESVQCVAEEIAVDINTEAVINLAEDASYKLRQVINTIGLHSELMKKSRVDGNDVNNVLRLMDTSPVVGCSAPQYAVVGDEKICFQVEYPINVTESALNPQTFVYSTVPTISVEWITDDKSLANNTSISINLRNYYTHVVRAILNLKKKLKQVAVEDLTSNTRIGPIFPNLFNLAVLVLNDDNLNALNVPAKKPLQSNVLDMVDALCSNPCSLDTNIQQQFQRLFPVMVSNILGNGSLAEKMVAILTKITRTWPSFITIGKGILFEYLSQGTKDRLTAPMIKCVLALGRTALVECLSDHLDHMDQVLHSTTTVSHKHVDLRDTLLEVSTCLLRSEPTTFLEDYVITDYTLYEMLGDSIMPRRLLFSVSVHHKDNQNKYNNNKDDELSNIILRRRPKIKIVLQVKKERFVPRDIVFEPTKFKHSNSNCRFNIRVSGVRNIQVKSERGNEVNRFKNAMLYNQFKNNSVAVACGLLNRFRYRLPTTVEMPLFATYLF